VDGGRHAIASLGNRLEEAAEGSIRKADKIVAEALSRAAALVPCNNSPFYAVGGTWRSLARLHMFEVAYPLHVMPNYALRADAHFLTNHLYLDVYRTRANQMRAFVSDINRMATVKENETGVVGEFKYSSRTSALFALRRLTALPIKERP